MKGKKIRLRETAMLDFRIEKKGRKIRFSLPSA
jgi:hypothetical protein